MIYLDHNATTVTAPQVIAAMREVAEAGEYNPSSAHALGRRAKRRLEDAREAIVGMLGADPNTDQLIFTSGGTEANNLAIRGLAGPPGSRIVLSAIEHPSIRAAADQLAGEGYEVRQVPVSSHGVVRVDRLAEFLSPPTRLVSIMLANHETGALQPVGEIARMCRRDGICLHTDAAQGLGKLPCDVRDLDVDAMTIVPHKFHGPRGIGGLLLRGRIPLRPILVGGPQQRGARAGTECVSLAVGMSVAISLFEADLEQRCRQLAQRRDALARGLMELTPTPVVVAQDVPRAPQTLCISFPGLDRQALVMALDQAGIACSTGSACASGSSQPSPVLQAMGLPDLIIRGAIRFSVGTTTTEAEVDQAIATIGRVVNALRSGRGGPP